METRTLTTRKGRTVATPYTDDEAIALLSEFLAKGGKGLSTFGLELLWKHEKYGLSAEQMIWVHILAVDIAGKDSQEETEPGDYSTAVNYLTTARDAGIKYPKVRLRSQDGDQVVMSLAGAQARQPGTVNLTDGRPYGSNVWYGRIGKDGKLDAGRAITDGVREVLGAFCADPAGTAKAQGALTGACCFCGKELTTKESVGAGYGPICAGRWGLPWGEETAAKYEEKKEAAIEAATEHATEYSGNGHASQEQEDEDYADAAMTRF